MQEKYDKTSVESILKFAQLLTGKTLNEVVTLPEQVQNLRNRGELGGLVEAHFFELPPTTANLDFPEAGLELKTTGLKIGSKGKYQAKERLVLTMINYLKIAEEDWESSTFYSKCKLMLILFYLYEGGIPTYDQRFVLDPLLFDLDNHDAEVIRRDWEFIKEKIVSGRAHELSEGDTFYLGACRKGAGGEGEKLRPQPNSPEGAKARAFSFKPSYMNLLIEGHAGKSRVLDTAKMSFEEATYQRFRPYLNMPVQEISTKMNYFKSGPNHKGFLRDLAVRILSRGGSNVPELDRAGIEMKTIRLRQNGSPRESMSFPSFKFMDIINEEWEESSFFEKLESKFLFIVFREDENGVERLDRAVYWNMPYLDRQEAQRVWADTKRRVIVDATDLPKTSESHVAHVRPKARDKNDTLPTPQGTYHVKQCFWLNSLYIKAVLNT
jgi:DNA mismatch repair protein MutH